MKTPFRLLALAAALLPLFLAGCGKTPEPASPPVATTTVGTEIDDSVITARVKGALMADPDIKSLDFKIETRKGEVQLSGFVESNAQVDRAMTVARGVEGVTMVENRLTLEGAETSVGTKVDDSILTTRVKGALMAEESIKSNDIAVISRDGQVQLSGFVNTQAQIDRAVAVARAVEGTRSVNNEMSVKK